MREILDIEKKVQTCRSCARGKHKCEGVVRVFSIHTEKELTPGKALLTTEFKEVPCECQSCHSLDTVQPPVDDDEPPL